jgi:hypothetical protein
MEVAGSSGAKDKSIPAAQAEDVLVESDSSELSVSTASNSTLKPDGGMTTDPERRQRRQARREAKAKRKEDEKLAAKKKRKEERKAKREERAKRRAAKKEEEKKKEKEVYDASSSELSSSTDDGDDDESYNRSKKDKKGKSTKEDNSNKKKYSAVSFNYSYLSNRDKKCLVNVPAGKLPHFDGTDFAKWKHLMSRYLGALHPGLWGVVCDGFQEPADPENPTNEEMIAVHFNNQATSILLSALNGNEYNRVMNVNVAKQIWDTLVLAHEGVDKVRKAKIDLMMAKLNRFVIVGDEGPQEMFDRLMVLVGKIRGYGGDLDDHKVVKVMLEAYSPRNETVVTLIRDKKNFEHFTPSDVLGRLLTFDMQREEANERRKLGELQAKLEGMKVNDIALKAKQSNKQGGCSKSKSSKQVSTSQPKKAKQVQECDPSSSSSDSDGDDGDYEKIDDIALFISKHRRGLKQHGFKFTPRKFQNKKKRLCFNCGSTEHLVAECPEAKKKKEQRHDNKRNYKRVGEAHIGHEWDSTQETSSGDEKVATMAVLKSTSSPRLFDNMTDDEQDGSPHICLMAKGGKVQTKSKSSPIPKEISSSELSDSSSDDDSSDDEFNEMTKKCDHKTKVYISRLMKEVLDLNNEIDLRNDDIKEQAKKNLAQIKEIDSLESEVAALKKSIKKEKESHTLTKKEVDALKQKYYGLDEKHKGLEQQYNLLWESTSQSSKSNETSTPSISESCGKCNNLDLNMYSTNLANMEAMKKEITRLTHLLNTKCENKPQGKEVQQNRPNYKDGRNPKVKDGLGHTKGGKTNGRDLVNGIECVKFTSKGKVGVEQPAQKGAQKLSRAHWPAKGGSEALKGGSAALPRQGKATNLKPELMKAQKKVCQPQGESQQPRKQNRGTPKKSFYQPKAKTQSPIVNTSFVLKNNSKGEVIAKYVGKGRNVYLNTSIWVPKIFVTNMQGPKKDWGPKPRN